MRILDPACGSGSVLLGAYQYLLNWHRDWYVSGLGARGSGLGAAAGASSPSPQSRVPGPDFPDRLYQGPGGQWLLTIQEKKRILLNHIYGVDIDPQAVETTKLSLLLKVLEGESEQTIGSTLRLFHERALPDLDKNIKCGNSLIGPDFYDGQQMTMFDEDERLRINAFDWAAEFPEVFRGSGSGSRVSGSGSQAPSPEPRGPSPDSGFDAVIGNPPYLSFSGRQAVEISEAERAYFDRHYVSSGWPTSHGLFIEIAAVQLSRRFLAFIVPDQVGHLAGYAPVRSTILGHHGLREVRYWGEDVFSGVVTPALTFVADATYHGPTTVYQPDRRSSTASYHEGEPWTTGHAPALLAKLRLNATSLGDLVADPGVHTGNCSEKLIAPLTDSAGASIPVLEGKQVSRYRCDPPRKALRLDYEAKEGEYFTIRPKEKYTAAQFVIRQTASFPIVGPRDHADYFRNSLLALYSPPDGTDVRYVVGVLNSRLIRYVYTQTVQESRQRAFPQVKVRSLRELPFRMPNLTLPVDKEAYDCLVNVVNIMLGTQCRLARAETPHAKSAAAREVQTLDRQIDQLVYQLYGLTDDEIGIVEEATQ